MHHRDLRYLCAMTKYHSNNILLNLGIENLNDMQVAAQQSILADNNILLLSPTGSGKTLAFLLPIFELLDPEAKRRAMFSFGALARTGLADRKGLEKMGTDLKVNVCYGGHSIDTEIKNLRHPPAILIGTPGRIADHMDRGTFSPDSILTLVLDEFDKSLQLGFHEEMSFIINKLTKVNKRIWVGDLGY
jgi:superfamily II DNA/RNA helicase